VFLESYGILRTRELHPKPAENVNEYKSEICDNCLRNFYFEQS
jgi:hypothetical protein